MNGRIDITLPSDAADPAAVPPALDAPATQLRSTSVPQVLRAGALVFAAALVIRAAFVEPFGVPTGSMAPTLIGVHRSSLCAHCGAGIAVGAPSEGTTESRHYAAARCPNCGAAPALESAMDAGGDRVLVDKLAFDWRTPRRWEVVVFRGPGDASRPMVKRVAGLPGERVRIREGDVIINGGVARKPLALCRALQVPVFDMTHAPPQAASRRWRADSTDAPENTPWVDGGELVFPVEAAKSLRWLALCGEPVRDGWVFNAESPDQGGNVHDFIVAFDVVVQRGKGEIAVALTDGADEVMAILPVGSGLARLSARGQSRESHHVTLRAGRRARVELAFIDRRAMLAVDGDEVMLPLELPAAATRAAVSRPVKIGACGVSATVAHLRLGRDVCYSSAGTHGVVNECTLGPDEYYVLGDNSGQSEDSRYWPTPGVPAVTLVGKPVWLHQPGRGPKGFDWHRFGPVR